MLKFLIDWDKDNGFNIESSITNMKLERVETLVGMDEAVLTSRAEKRLKEIQEENDNNKS